MTSPVPVRAVWGTEGNNWDISFDRPQLAYARAADAGIDRIAVVVEDDGSVSLNRGYREDSPEGRAEKALFDEYRYAIDEALLAEIADPEDRCAFFARCEDEAEARRDALREQAVDIELEDL